MKKQYIIAILLIIAGVAAFMSASKDVSTYAFFKDANGKRVKVVGTLSKDKPMDYDPENNPDQFSFTMKDGDGIEKKVVLGKPKPQDFEMSEQIVVTGTLKNDIFEADEILMKCPSKYKDEEIAVRSNVKE